MTLVSIPLMDRTGRRTLHLYGLGGMFIFSIFITISFLIKASSILRLLRSLNNPRITIQKRLSMIFYTNMENKSIYYIFVINGFCGLYLNPF